MSELERRMKLKSKSNTIRYTNGNLNATEYRLLQLELLDLATMATTLNEYVTITNAIYIDCDSVEVII